MAEISSPILPLDKFTNNIFVTGGKSIFNSVELPLRKKIDSIFKRGSFDISVVYKKKNDTEKSFDDLDWEKISAVLKRMKECSIKENVQVSVTPVDFLRSDFL